MLALRPFRSRALALAVLLLAAAALPSAPARAGEAFPDPFEDARYLPATITQYYCFVDAGESLAELMDSSLAPGLKAFYESGQSGKSWKDLAAATGVDPDTLFDMLVSKRVTLVTDQQPDAHAGRGKGPDFSRWVMMAHVDEPFARDLLKMLGGRVREFVDDTPLYAAENGSLRFAYSDGRFYLTAADGEALLKTMLGKPTGRSLADDDEFRDARSVGPGDFGMFLRGSGEGRWKAGAAKLRRDRMYLNFASVHEPRGIDGKPDDAVNLGLLGTLAEHALYVSIERTPEPGDPPCDRRTGPALIALVPIALAQPEMLEHLGPTMFTVIDSPEATAAGATGVPAMTVGIEMRQPDQAVGELDEFMGHATARLSKFRRGKRDKDEPAPAVSFAGTDPDDLRTAEWRGAGLPMNTLGLSGAWPERVVWSSVDGKDRAWWVASTDELCQRRIAAKLQEVDPPCRTGSQTQARGVIFGGRVSSLIEQWPAVSAETEHPFLAELFGWRELLSAVSEIRWRVTQPTPERTETGISIAWKCNDRD